MAKTPSAAKPAGKTSPASKKPAAKAGKGDKKAVTKRATKVATATKRGGRKPRLDSAAVLALRKEYGSVENSRSRRSSKGDVTYSTLAQKHGISFATARSAVLGTGAYASI